LIVVRYIIVALLLVCLPLNSYALKLEDEKKYGRLVYLEIVKSAPINHDPYLSLRLDEIKDRLEGAANLPFPIKLTVVDSPSVEAFATVGGYVYVTRGLIEMCDKEEEVAGVLGHEFGHVSRRHIAKRVEKEKFLSVGNLAALLLGALIPSPAGKAAVMTSGLGAMQAMSLKYSREDEEEADRVGLATSENVGYSGKGIGDFLKKLRTAGLEKTLPQYLLTHPYSDDRVIAIESSYHLAKTTVDVSLFPFIVVRTKIFPRPLTSGTEEIWINRYAKEPASPTNVYGAALVYSLKGNWSAAVKTINTIDSPYKTLFLGEVLLNGLRFREAAEVLATRDDPVSRFLLAKAYEGQGELGLAADVLKGLIPRASTFPDIYQRLGMVKGRQGDQAAGYEYLGRYYYELGREATARNYFEKAVGMYGMNSPEAREILKLLEQMKK
jgi:beta-barrel assembly-enhancing protease